MGDCCPNYRVRGGLRQCRAPRLLVATTSEKGAAARRPTAACREVTVDEKQAADEEQCSLLVAHRPARGTADAGRHLPDDATRRREAQIERLRQRIESMLMNEAFEEDAAGMSDGMSDLLRSIAARKMAARKAVAVR